MRHMRMSGGLRLAAAPQPGSRCDDLPVAYYMRFLSEDDQPLNLEEIMSGLRSADPGFRLDEGGILAKGEELLAELEVNEPGEELFAVEIDELRELARQSSGTGEAVAARLESVTAILAVRVLSQKRTAEQTLSLLDPLWHWLQAYRRGLVQADGEGFYEGQRPILATG